MVMCILQVSPPYPTEFGGKHALSKTKVVPENAATHQNAVWCWL